MTDMSYSDDPISYRIGHGYDLHRLEPINTADTSSARAKPLILCGIPIDHDHGPVGHSDGDAALHAVTDAVLGALGEPDIGEIFPNSSPKWKDADSSLFLRDAVARARASGFSVINMDLTIILERPKISPYKDKMRLNLANLLEVPTDCVNVKGKTHEKVDAVGEGRAVETHAVVLLRKTRR